MDWKSEFHSLYISKSLDGHGKALDLKRDHLPQKLYRYRPVSDDNLEFRRQELLGGLYMAHPDELNDPFEGWSMLQNNDPSAYVHKEAYTDYFASIGQAEIYKDVFEKDNWLDVLIDYTAKQTVSEEKVDETKIALARTIMYGIEMMNSAINQTTRNMVRIACFSTSPKNLPMWYHYTNNHAGICLEYDTSLIQNVYQLNRLFPVYYVDKLPDMAYLLGNRENPSFTFFDALAIHKLKDWSYEDEWRLLYDPGAWYYSPSDIPKEFWSSGKLINFMPPTKVLLGKNIDSIHEKTICKYADIYHIPVEKADFTNYGLEFNPLDSKCCTTVKPDSTVYK